MTDLHAPLPPPVGEGGSDIAAALDFVVPVAPVGQRRLQVRDAGQRLLDARQRFAASLPQADEDIALGGYAVTTRHLGMRGAYRDPFAHPRDATREALGLGAAVGQASCGGRRIVDDDPIGDAIVARPAVEGAQGPVQALRARLQADRGRVSPRGGVRGCQQSARRGAEPAQRDALVHDVDQSANRTSAEGQGSRAAQDLDALGGQRIGGYRVIRTQPRYVERVQAVVGDADPRAVEASDDRPAGAGAEAAALHARLARQRGAERAVEGPLQGRGLQHTDRARRSQRVGAERIGADPHRGQHHGGCYGVGGRGLRQGGGAGQSRERGGGAPLRSVEEDEYRSLHLATKLYWQSARVYRNPLIYRN